MVPEKVEAPPEIGGGDRRTFELWIFRFHNYLNKMVNKKSANRIAFSIQGNANRLRSKDKFGSCPVINTIHHFYFIFVTKADPNYLNMIHSNSNYIYQNQHLNGNPPKKNRFNHYR